ncbi:MAG: COG1361 S-layer family protein [Candidatus Micrarchaeaceae archaeon]
MEYKYAFAAVLLVAFVQLFGTASAQQNALSIANLAVYPQPVVAGSNITIAFQLFNSYTNELTNVNLELVGTYPLLNSSPSGTQIITDVPEGLYGGTALLVYKLHIPKDVNSGTYSLDVAATYQTVSGSNVQESATSTMPISFYIRGSPDLQLTANPVTGILPGSQSTVVMDVLNAGTDNATNTSITFLNSRNFSVIGESTFNLGTISPQRTSGASTILLANSTLPSGASRLPVIVRYDTQYGTNVIYTEMVPVSVSLGNPDLGIGIESASPASLYPGSNQTIVLSLQNVGSGTAKNITISALDNRNITAGNSASKIFVGTIAAGSSATASMFITASKSDNRSKYSLPILISYQNANYNTTFNKTVQVPITLSAIAQFNVTHQSTNLTIGGTYVPVTLRVKNTGNEVAQSIVFSLQTIYPISQVNPNAYVTSLAPGQSVNMTFYVNVDSQANPGQYPISLYEQWSQPTGSNSQQYSGSQDYYVVVGGQSGYGNLQAIAIIAVIAVAAAAYYKLKVKGARKSEQKKERKQ